MATSSAQPHLIALPRGARVPDDLLSAVKTVVGEDGAVVCAIGAVADPVIAYYRRREQRYVETELSGEWEVVSLLGNVARKEGEPFLHAHIALSDAAGHMRGGHLVRASVAVTLEIAVWPTVYHERRFDADIGLFLLPPFDR